MLQLQYMNTYVTTTEIKSFLGISVSTYDTVLGMYNTMATDILNGILSASDLSLHLVSEEKHTGGQKSLELHDLHVQAIGTIMDDELEYTQTDPYDIDGYILNLEKWLSGAKRKVLVDYVAGWNAGGYAKITISDYTLLAAKTVTVAPGGSGGTTKTEGADWTAATSNAATATSLASAIDAVSGIRSFALGAVVYVVDETAQRTTSTLATSASSGLSLSAATLGSVDFPESLRFAIFTLVSGMWSKYKKHRVRTYTIGTKSVTFASEDDATAFKTAIKAYQRAKLFVL